MTLRPALLAVLAAASPTLAADVTFGALPSGASSTNLVSEVSAEICRDHLFDAARVRAKLPAGYRLLPAREYAKEESAVADLLTRSPRYSEYAVGSLCLLSVGRFEVDGVRVHPPGQTPMAFWWVRGIGPRDPRMQGKVEWLQLASWYSRELTARQEVLATDPMAKFVDLSVTQAEPGHWRLRLVLPGETIEADVEGRGPRSRRESPQPGFMSVPFTGAASDRFWVITYFGHHHQPALGRWRARGRGVFSESLAIPGEGTTFATVFQDGWSALAAVYPVER